ncbi:hypothetical protein K3729_02645 [Rhodobacteraceae bacterium S2214]|nr:hypothetical protein K3729_02645 [Rhodobacteraceae bacterium S2214]
MRRLAAILALMPTLAAAGPYDGTYKQVANADCANVGVDGGALKIEEGIFFGVDVQCRMTRPVDVLQMDATLYTMQCSNDDEVWTERAMLMDAADDDGIIMIWNGYAFAYSACEPE